MLRGKHLQSPSEIRHRHTFHWNLRIWEQSPCRDRTWIVVSKNWKVRKRIYRPSALFHSRFAVHHSIVGGAYCPADNYSKSAFLPCCTVVNNYQWWTSILDSIVEGSFFVDINNGHQWCRWAALSDRQICRRCESIRRGKGSDCHSKRKEFVHGILIRNRDDR